MTDMKDPVRLSLGGAPDVQALLRSADGDLPGRRQLDHLASRLAPVVAAAPAASSLLPWIVVGVVVLGATGAVLLGRDRASSSPEPVASAPAPVAVPSAPLPAPAAVTPAAAVVAEEQPLPAPARTAKAKHKEPKAEVTDIAPPPREMDLLGPAHEALAKRDHARALELAARHAELYPSGAFIEEREAIAIEALLRLGRDETRTRFAEFVARFPRSGYRPRLERLLGESSR